MPALKYSCSEHPAGLCAAPGGPGGAGAGAGGRGSRGGQRPGGGRGRRAGRRGTGQRQEAGSGWRGAERGGGSEGKLTADLSGSSCSSKAERGARDEQDARPQDTSHEGRALSRGGRGRACRPRAWSEWVQSLGTFWHATGSPEVVRGERRAGGPPKGTPERLVRSG